MIPLEGRVAIIAGSGALPGMLAEALKDAGHEPFVVMIEGETDPALGKYDHCALPLEHLAGLLGELRKRNAVTLVLAGGIARRPRLRDVRPSLDLLRALPRLVKAMAMGDDGLLRYIVNSIEARGIRVAGAHEFLPDIVIGTGAITRRKPTRQDRANLEAAAKAARMLGALDVGQGTVAVGGRVIALEGAEGTAAMLARVAELRQAGRISRTDPGVLVKCSKPGQELRVDMPAIGPETIAQAKAAGLAGIAVEEGRTMVLERDRTLSLAEQEGLFIYGLEPETAP